MYRDRKLAREHVLKIRLSDYEAELLDALTNYTGEQKASLARDFVMRGVEHALHDGLGVLALEGAGSGPVVASKRTN